MSYYLALDLGAESGRGVLGKLEHGRLELSEIHRFPNQPVALPDGLHWNIPGLFAEIKHAITRACRKVGAGQLQGLGVDTWGVDYALLDRRGELLGLPFHYRDHRTDGMLERVLDRVPRERIFDATGVQFMQINTLVQLFAARQAGSASLDAADSLLFLPDLFHYWLSGETICEFTVATTSQLFDPRRNEWAAGLMADLTIPSGLFRPVTQPGMTLGSLRRVVAEETGGGDTQVLVPAGHDTACAVAAVPAVGHDFVFLSSGTWSLIGMELPGPAVTPEALAGNFTNEGGVSGTYRFLKNIMGLWLVQECRRSWARAGKDYSYTELASLAAAASPFAAYVDPDDSSFLSPDDMPAALRAYWRAAGQPELLEPGAIVRTCLEGLALKYRETILKLEAIAGRTFATLHIVGGGTQNRLLCQFAANATGKLVVAGPVEATAAGNILTQTMGHTEIRSLKEAREVVRRSFPVEEYYPQDTARWAEAFDRFGR